LLYTRCVSDVRRQLELQLLHDISVSDVRRHLVIRYCRNGEFKWNSWTECSYTFLFKLFPIIYVTYWVYVFTVVVL